MTPNFLRTLLTMSLLGGGAALILFALKPLLSRPQIILPARNYPPQVLRNILLHEMTHARRHDLTVKWLATLAVAVHWFNPIVHLLRREINRACELSCDEAVIRQMNGGSLSKELYDSGINVAPSAFVQQRTKLSPDIFREILHNFNRRHNDVATYHEYRVLAVDGTCINTARNPNADSFVRNASNPKGYNQLHLNPLYDVWAKTHFDCWIQPQPKPDKSRSFPFLLQKAMITTVSQILSTSCLNV